MHLTTPARRQLFTPCLPVSTWPGLCRSLSLPAPPAVFDLLERKQGRPESRWRAALQRVLHSGAVLLVSLLLTIMVRSRDGT